MNEQLSGSEFDCLVCRKHQGELLLPGGPIFEDECVFACHAYLASTGSDQYLGYLMLETRRHVPGLYDLTDLESRTIGLFASKLARALRETEAAEHVYAFVIGDGIPHFHMHIVARYPGAPKEYWGPRVDDWPDAPRGGEAEITVVCSRIRDYLTISK
jgi:diadenosine tetraphosphate (Ap4A) HIT family hydrolase